MPQRCTTCDHADRAAIDAALVEGTVSNRKIAAHFGVSEQAIRRHKAEHLPAALADAETAQRVARADTLIVRVDRLSSRMERLLDKAEAGDRFADAAALSREVRGCVELLAKLSGQLRDGPTIYINSPQVQIYTTALLQALAPWPEARIAAARALELIDAG